MKNVLIPFLVLNTLLALLAGALLLLQVHARLFPEMGDPATMIFLGALLLSPPLGIVVAVAGPQRPVGLLGLEGPQDADARGRAQSRLKNLLRILMAGFFLGLALGVGGSFGRKASDIGGVILACAGTLLVLVAPWIALYARWFRINWF